MFGRKLLGVISLVVISALAIARSDSGVIASAILSADLPNIPLICIPPMALGIWLASLRARHAKRR